jgi:hypothetical protein
VYCTKGGISPIEYPGGSRGVLLFLDLLLEGREVMLKESGRGYMCRVPLMAGVSDTYTAPACCIVSDYYSMSVVVYCKVRLGLAYKALSMTL